MQFIPSHAHFVFISLTSLIWFFENLNGQYFLLASSLVTNIIVPPLLSKLLPESKRVMRLPPRLGAYLSRGMKHKSLQEGFKTSWRLPEGIFWNILPMVTSESLRVGTD